MVCADQPQVGARQEVRSEGGRTVHLFSTQRTAARAQGG
jgi:hypothetical protein